MGEFYIGNTCYIMPDESHIATINNVLNARTLNKILILISLILLFISSIASIQADNKTVPGIFTSLLLIIVIVFIGAFVSNLRYTEKILKDAKKCIPPEGTFKDDNITIILKDSKYTIKCKNSTDITGSFKSSTEKDQKGIKIEFDKEINLCGAKKIKLAVMVQRYDKGPIIFIIFDEESWPYGLEYSSG